MPEGSEARRIYEAAEARLNATERDVLGKMQEAIEEAAGREMTVENTDRLDVLCRDKRQTAEAFAELRKSGDFIPALEMGKLQEAVENPAALTKEMPGSILDNSKKIEWKAVECKENGNVVARRVQGGSGTKKSQERVLVNVDGSIHITKKNTNLNVSLDYGEHAAYFLKERRVDDNAYVVQFEIPDYLYDLIVETTIPQEGSKNNLHNLNGMAPKLTDVDKAGNSIEFPPPWVEWLEEHATNGKIIQRKEGSDA